MPRGEHKKKTIRELHSLGEAHEFVVGSHSFFVDYLSLDDDAVIFRLVDKDDFIPTRHLDTYELLEAAESGELVAFVENTPTHDHVLVGFTAPKDSALLLEDILSKENTAVINSAVNFCSGVRDYHNVPWDR